MSNKAREPRALRNFKQQCKDLKKAQPDIKLAQVQEIMARDAGFDSYKSLRSALINQPQATQQESK